MAPCMGPVSPVRAYSLWAGLCPEKLVKQNKTKQNKTLSSLFLYQTSPGTYRPRLDVISTSNRWQEKKKRLC